MGEVLLGVAAIITAVMTGVTGLVVVLQNAKREREKLVTELAKLLSQHVVGESGKHEAEDEGD